MSEVDFLDVAPPLPTGGRQQEVPSKLATLAPLLALGIPGIGPLIAAIGVGAQGGRRQSGLNENAFIREANRAGTSVAGLAGDPGALERAAVGQRGRTRQETIERAGLLRADETRRLAGEAVGRAEAKTRQEQQNKDRDFIRIAREGLVNDLAPALGDLRGLNTALRSVLTANDDFAGDQAMVFNFARAITGGGGQSLSDKDVQRLGGSGALGETVQRWIGTLTAGRRLTPNDRKAISQQMVQSYRQAREEISTSFSPTFATADRLGISRGELFGDSFISDDVLRQALGGGGFDPLPLAGVRGAGRPGVTSTVEDDGTIVVRSAP